MKLIRFGEKNDERPGVIDSNGKIRDLSSYFQDYDKAFFLSDGLEKIKRLNYKSAPVIDEPVRIAPPIANVGKFICVGLNYADHAAESGMDVPDEPVLFMKATSSIVGPNDAVVLPPDSEKSDWEVELGVIIGKEAKYVSEEDAMDYVAGFCLINDLSERTYQLEKGGQWCKGKGCDTFAPMGPFMATADEVKEPNNLHIWLEVNGEIKQNGNTNTMVFTVPFLVHYISQFMSLQPGDVISTGTPPGVGLGMTPPQYLKEGDEMRLGIEGLGEQVQKVERYKK
ncbi:fumarylacetoacetate hydrolase family protein [Pseudoalteromonas phenolica]|uniref:Ureidoglycolate lyase n=1 Tax=Pseudoalteromonas phenolica TaxID=161398 RepID=A0A0S2K3S4_9GAMM|nr:fumarylacetoacetate hydrolase family protein [Pseudoalteromonas phenolica]ALO42873.1 Ureidoglycolate lyase [Pseudoalteromonas phenolica]MBE0355992.1 5-oxopent-3-ene-1,2,5-tricarboxylate decarboxylase / 2-hydroxyhepta-2,4-diene-1,7-dioate isomerase [Pseudoalteromonas phenolica O-BC30]RXE94662.1 FAA hydrolase family protein [Pseudoalteromonas phenolica O-BC30]